MSRLSWKQLTRPKVEGGLGIIDFNLQILTLQAKWVPRIFDHTHAPWKHLVIEHVCAASLQLWSIAISKEMGFPRHSPQTIGSPLWQSIWFAWNQCRTFSHLQTPPNQGGSLADLLFYNCHDLAYPQEKRKHLVGLTGRMQESLASTISGRRKKLVQ